MRIKMTIGWAVVCEMPTKKPHLEYAFTWDKKNIDEKNQKSELVYAIYPEKKQAEADVRFRGGSVVKKIILQ